MLNYLHEVNSVITADLTAYHKQAADLLPITTAAAALAAAIDDNTIKQDAAIAATKAKNAAHLAGLNTVKSLVNQILMDPTITDADKNALRLYERDMTASTTGLLPPMNVVVVGFSDGTNKLTWKSGGNPTGTIYQIEARKGVETGYTIIGTETKCKFNHINQTPGVMIRYRVLAKRHGELSSPSNEAVVYG